MLRGTVKMICSKIIHPVDSHQLLSRLNVKETLSCMYYNLQQCKRFGIDPKKMNRHKVLVTRSDIPVVALNLLREECDLVFWDKPIPIPRSELISKISGVKGVFCVLTDKIDDEILNAAGPELKVVATMSVGLDHLNLKVLKDRNIYVGYTPGVLTNATAELTVALLLATSRRLFEANKAIFKGEWKAWAPTWMCGTGLPGSTIGIVGLGRIGYKVAKILKAFDVSNILYTSRKSKEEASEFGGKKVEIDELLGDSDFVIVTIAATPDTVGMFNMDLFKKMKKSAIFINVSRGEIVKQSDLIEALKTGVIKAAGLDVTTPEPLPLDSELLQLPNCVVLPHIGSATIETREEMAKITAKNILAVLKGTPEAMPSPLHA